MQDFRNVDVWKKMHSLVLTIFEETRSISKEEVFGITLQLRRGSILIASRIAEGCGRDSDADFAVDLRKARSGCNELEYLLLLAKDLEFIKADVHERLCDRTIEVRKMLYGLLRAF